MIYKNKKGIASIVVLAIMGFLAVSLPVATKLVQQNQENRSSAASSKTCTAADVAVGKKYCQNSSVSCRCISVGNYQCKKCSEWGHSALTLCNGAGLCKNPSISKPTSIPTTSIDSALVNGSCKYGSRTCLSGTLKDTLDTETQYKWDCEGINGGVTIHCVQDRPITPALNQSSEEKVIIIAGASGITRMFWYAKSYTDSLGDVYTLDKNLFYIEKSGSGITWLLSEKDGEALSLINNVLNKFDKNKTEFYILFASPGNSYTAINCDQASSRVPDYMSRFSNVSKKWKEAGYKTKVYYISQTPVKPAEAKVGGIVVSNTNSKKCDAAYRSNYKYKVVNDLAKATIKNQYSDTLSYIDLFGYFLAGSRYGKYHTSEGIHADEQTAKDEVKYLIEEVLNNPVVK